MTLREFHQKLNELQPGESRAIPEIDFLGIEFRPSGLEKPIPIRQRKKITCDYNMIDRAYIFSRLNK